jgi:hypothetical protein
MILAQYHRQKFRERIQQADKVDALVNRRGKRERMKAAAEQAATIGISPEQIPKRKKEARHRIEQNRSRATAAVEYLDAKPMYARDPHDSESNPNQCAVEYWEKDSLSDQLTVVDGGEILKRSQLTYKQQIRKPNGRIDEIIVDELENWQFAHAKQWHAGGVVMSAFLVRKLTSDRLVLGVISSRQSRSGWINPHTHCLGTDTSQIGYVNNGTLLFNNQNIPYGQPYHSGDIITVCMNFLKGEISFFINDIWQGVANPICLDEMATLRSITGENGVIKDHYGVVLAASLWSQGTQVEFVQPPAAVRALLPLLREHHILGGLSVHRDIPLRSLFHDQYGQKRYCSSCNRYSSISRGPRKPIVGPWWSCDDFACKQQFASFCHACITTYYNDGQPSRAVQLLHEQHTDSHYLRCHSSHTIPFYHTSMLFGSANTVMVPPALASKEVVGLAPREGEIALRAYVSELIGRNTAAAVSPSLLWIRDSPRYAPYLTDVHSGHKFEMLAQMVASSQFNPQHSDTKKNRRDSLLSPNHALTYGDTYAQQHKQQQVQASHDIVHVAVPHVNPLEQSIIGTDVAHASAEVQPAESKHPQLLPPPSAPPSPLIPSPEPEPAAAQEHLHSPLPLQPVQVTTGSDGIVTASISPVSFPSPTPSAPASNHSRMLHSRFLGRAQQRTQQLSIGQQAAAAMVESVAPSSVPPLIAPSEQLHLQRRPSRLDPLHQSSSPIPAVLNSVEEEIRIPILKGSTPIRSEGETAGTNGIAPAASGGICIDSSSSIDNHLIPTPPMHPFAVPVAGETEIEQKAAPAAAPSPGPGPGPAAVIHVSESKSDSESQSDLESNSDSEGDGNDPQTTVRPTVPRQISVARTASQKPVLQRLASVASIQSRSHLHKHSLVYDGPLYWEPEQAESGSGMDPAAESNSNERLFGFRCSLCLQLDSSDPSGCAFFCPQCLEDHPDTGERWKRFVLCMECFFRHACWAKCTATRPRYANQLLQPIPQRTAAQLATEDQQHPILAPPPQNLNLPSRTELLGREGIDSSQCNHAELQSACEKLSTDVLGWIQPLKWLVSLATIPTSSRSVADPGSTIPTPPSPIRLWLHGDNIPRGRLLSSCCCVVLLEGMQIDALLSDWECSSGPRRSFDALRSVVDDVTVLMLEPTLKAIRFTHTDFPPCDAEVEGQNAGEDESWEEFPVHRLEQCLAAWTRLLYLCSTLKQWAQKYDPVSGQTAIRVRVGMGVPLSLSLPRPHASPLMEEVLLPQLMRVSDSQLWSRFHARYSWIRPGAMLERSQWGSFVKGMGMERTVFRLTHLLPNDRWTIAQVIEVDPLIRRYQLVPPELRERNEMKVRIDRWEQDGLRQGDVIGIFDPSTYGWRQILRAKFGMEKGLDLGLSLVHHMNESAIRVAPVDQEPAAASAQVVRKFTPVAPHLQGRLGNYFIGVRVLLRWEELAEVHESSTVALMPMDTAVRPRMKQLEELHSIQSKFQSVLRVKNKEMMVPPSHHPELVQLSFLRGWIARIQLLKNKHILNIRMLFLMVSGFTSVISFIETYPVREQYGRWELPLVLFLTLIKALTVLFVGGTLGARYRTWRMNKLILFARFEDRIADERSREEAERRDRDAVNSKNVVGAWFQRAKVYLGSQIQAAISSSAQLRLTRMATLFEVCDIFVLLCQVRMLGTLRAFGRVITSERLSQSAKELLLSGFQGQLAPEWAMQLGLYVSVVSLTSASVADCVLDLLFHMLRKDSVQWRQKRRLNDTYILLQLLLAFTVLRSVYDLQATQRFNDLHDVAEGKSVTLGQYSGTPAYIWPASISFALCYWYSVSWRNRVNMVSLFLRDGAAVHGLRHRLYATDRFILSIPLAAFSIALMIQVVNSNDMEWKQAGLLPVCLFLHMMGCVATLLFCYVGLWENTPDKERGHFSPLGFSLVNQFDLFSWACPININHPHSSEEGLASALFPTRDHVSQ